jgi:hypothetical protein
MAVGESISFLGFGETLSCSTCLFMAGGERFSCFTCLLSCGESVSLRGFGEPLSFFTSLLTRGEAVVFWIPSLFFGDWFLLGVPCSFFFAFLPRARSAHDEQQHNKTKRFVNRPSF